jgi:hypothetical protein
VSRPCCMSSSGTCPALSAAPAAAWAVVVAGWRPA